MCGVDKNCEAWLGRAQPCCPLNQNPPILLFMLVEDILGNLISGKFSGYAVSSSCLPQPVSLLWGPFPLNHLEVQNSRVSSWTAEQNQHALTSPTVFSRRCGEWGIRLGKRNTYITRTNQSTHTYAHTYTHTHTYQQI